MSQSKRLLFLSGSLGGGHDALAEACAGVLMGAGVDSRIVDCLALMGNRSGRTGSWMFARLVGSPFYDAFHFGQLHGDGRLGAWADRAAAARIYPRLVAEVDAFEPDVVMPVFATGVGAACRMKREGRCQQVVVFLPDSVAHRLWVHEDVDLYLVTSALGAASVRRYQPESVVRVVDAPVDARFVSPPSQSAARLALGIPAEAHCVLLMAGAWGIGPLDAIAASLGEAGFWVLAVGGTNEALVRRLRAVALRYPSVIPLGYSDRVPELMSACDVVVTTSGATCREARAVGRGLILLDVIPGHGRENLLHQLELGQAAVASAAPAEVTRAVRAFLEDPGLWDGPERRHPVAGTFIAALDEMAALDEIAGLDGLDGLEPAAHRRSGSRTEAVRPE